jgi:predicted RNA-binding Zn-ribbon protein involved in translation (DUF1610 family)
MPKSRKQLADEAYLRNAAKIEQEELGLVELSQVNEIPKSPIVPKTCPGCGLAKGVRVAGWTLMHGDIVQCGNCGYRLEVPRDEFVKYGKALHEAYASPAAPVKGKR